VGLKLSVYFWRDDDAGYVFDSDVQDEVFSRGTASLKISHSDNMARTQKRHSIRIKTHKAAFLYILDSDDASHNVELSPGLKCFVEDISDSGCAVLVGGKAAVGLRIKVQFVLNNMPICISGTVRHLDYHEDTHKSLLHTEADPMPLETRNQILGEVFGMLPEEDDELPFSILDEEAESEALEETHTTSAVSNDAL
jgi:c-di-GMP-binding flagellar brake protein YcgR